MKAAVSAGSETADPGGEWRGLFLPLSAILDEVAIGDISAA